LLSQPVDISSDMSLEEKKDFFEQDISSIIQNEDFSGIQQTSFL
jgi:hypothetical protein